MKRIVFSIPSYRRADRQHFAKYLHDLGIPKDDIYVFVQNDEDRAAYKASVGDIANVVGENGVGVSFNRNQSMRLNVPNAYVVQVDDGVKSVGIKGVGKLKDGKRLVEMCRKFFDYCERNGFAQWALSKSSNPLCMTGRDKIDYPFFGVFVGMLDRSVPFNPSMKLMEDVERNCRMLRAGKHMIIFDYAHVDCKHNQRGGLGDLHAHIEIERRAAHIICTTFPDMVQPKDSGINAVNMRCVWPRRRLTKVGVLYGKI